jgi:nitrite reductase (NADH) small subunit/3-phenylpropionate/trans-cinnamate dioxygenase ferredoxin subunit
MAQIHYVCKVSDIPDGEAKRFVVDDTMIGVFHIDGKFYALDDRCPHAGASLTRGDIKGDVVCCRIHLWRFSIRDGTYLDEAKPDLNARSYTVRVVADQILVEV